MNSCFLLSPLGLFISFFLIQAIIWFPIWGKAARKYIQRNRKLIANTPSTYYPESLSRKQKTNVLVKEISEGPKSFFYEEEVTSTGAKQWIRKEKKVMPKQRPIRALLPPANIVTLDSYLKEEINQTRIDSLV